MLFHDWFSGIRSSCKVGMLASWVPCLTKGVKHIFIHSISEMAAMKERKGRRKIGSGRSMLICTSWVSLIWKVWEHRVSDFGVTCVCVWWWGLCKICQDIYLEDELILNKFSHASYMAYMYSLKVILDSIFSLPAFWWQLGTCQVCILLALKDLNFGPF